MRQLSLRRLQDYQVRLIRQMRREGFRRRFLAGLFGISVTALQHILNYETYKDIR